MIDKFLESYRYAKANYCKQRVVYNYIVLPVLLLFGFLDLLVVLLLLAINGERFLVPCVILFLLMVVFLVIYLCFQPYVKKKDTEKEIERLKTFFSEPLLASPETDYVLPRGDGGGVIDLTFSDDGYTIGTLKYSYKAFDLALYTSSYSYRANLIVVFKRNGEGDKEDGDNIGVKEFSLPLDLNLLSIMNKYDLQIINPDVMKFVKENVEVAVKQIMEYGKIQENYYKTR